MTQPWLAESNWEQLAEWPWSFSNVERTAGFHSDWDEYHLEWIFGCLVEVSKLATGESYMPPLPVQDRDVHHLTLHFASRNSLPERVNETITGPPHHHRAVEVAIGRIQAEVEHPPCSGLPGWQACDNEEAQNSRKSLSCSQWLLLHHHTGPGESI